MLTLCDGRFTLEKDPYQWVMIEAYDGKDSNGKPKKQKRKTYHPTLRNAFGAILDHMACDCTSVYDLTELYASAVDLLDDYAAWNMPVKHSPVEESEDGE